MLKKLRRKMIAMNLAFVTVLLAVVVLVIGYASYAGSLDGIYHELTLLTDQALSDLSYQTETGRPALPHNQSHVPYLAVLLQEDGSYSTISSQGVQLDRPQLDTSIAEIRSSDEPSGTLEDYSMAFYRTDSPQGEVLVLRDIVSVKKLMIIISVTTVSLFAVSAGLCLLLTFGTTRMVLRPISDAWEKQNQFVANASHDLKTPLTVLMANTNIIASHPQETVAQQQKWLNSMAEESEKMQHLINDMLTLAKVESYDAPIKLVPLHVSDLIEEEALYMEPVAYEKDITMDLQIQKHVTWDSNRALLRKLVSLLVDNAIKYSPPGGKVTVCFHAGKTAVLSVRNFGPAIPKEDLDHLFERFYRSDKSRSTSGYGLGLAIAKLTAQQLHGSIRVTSTEEEGTVFTVELKS